MKHVTKKKHCMLVYGKLWGSECEKNTQKHQMQTSKMWQSLGPLKLYKELKSMIVRIKIKIIFKISTNKNIFYKQRYRKQWTQFIHESSSHPLIVQL